MFKARRRPDVQLVGAGGEVPVDAAHVVARQVGPRVAGFGTHPGEQPLVVAVQQSVEATEHDELELAQELLRRGKTGGGRGHDAMAGRRSS